MPSSSGGGLYWPAPGACDAWTVGLSHVDALGSARAALSVDERLRAERMSHTARRDRYIAAHGALRMILRLYLGAVALEEPFRMGPCGKPYLAGQGPSLHFSLSYSADQALIAISREEIGADIEAIRLFDDLPLVARGICAPRELAILTAASGGISAPRFFRLWTMKEAVCKATGEGLSADLRGIDLSSALASRGRGARAAGYQGLSLVIDRRAPRGYAVALAARGLLGAVRAFRTTLGAPSFPG